MSSSVFPIRERLRSKSHPSVSEVTSWSEVTSVEYISRLHWGSASDASCSFYSNDHSQPGLGCTARAPARSESATAYRGQPGEEEAYFHLRKLGYIMVKRNFRSPRCRGEIDLIGWEGDVLCFIEVKTRTSRDGKPIAEVAREYLRRLPPSCQWRLDIVSVYYDSLTPRPQMEVFRNASLAGRI